MPKKRQTREVGIDMEYIYTLQNATYLGIIRSACRMYRNRHSIGY